MNIKDIREIIGKIKCWLKWHLWSQPDNCSLTVKYVYGLRLPKNPGCGHLFQVCLRCGARREGFFQCPVKWKRYTPMGKQQFMEWKQRVDNTGKIKEEKL